MHKLTISCFFLVIILFSLSLSGCGRAKNNFVYDLGFAPKNLDPQSAADESSNLVIANLFEGLITIGADGKVLSGMAENWVQSPDGRTYTFHLRTDANWSNGDSVVAADFVYAFQRLFDPATNAPAVADFFCIQNGKAVYEKAAAPETLGVQAEDAHTLVIRLDNYNARFLELLATPSAMPCQEKFFRKTKGKYGLAADKILGNGAFYLTSWSETGTVRLRPNAEYYGRSAITATSLTLAVPPAEAPSADLSAVPTPSALERFLLGTTSAVALSGKDFLRLGKTSHLETAQSDNSVWGISFRLDKEPFSNSNIRQALFLDADFSTMEPALPAYLEHAQAVIPKNITLAGENYRQKAGQNLMPALDRAEAVRLYLQGMAALPEAALRGARMIVPAGLGHEEYFAYLSQIWQRDFGFYLTVEVLDDATYRKRLESGDYECALLNLSGAYNSPASVLSALSKAGWSRENCANFEALLDGAAAESDAAAAIALYRQAEQFLLEENTFLPLYYQAEYFVLNTGITGISYNFDRRMPDFRFGVLN